jgi:hypothetical protein
MVRREVIEDARRYIPHPTIRNSLLLNVENEKTLLTRPPTNMITVRPAFIFTMTDCLFNFIFGTISSRKKSSSVKPMVFV